MPIVINLTKHALTADQIRDGGVELPGLRACIDNAQDYKSLDDVSRAKDLAWKLAVAVNQDTKAMHEAWLLGLNGKCWHEAPVYAANVAGAAWLMVPLCAYLRQFDIQPVCSFSQRICEEVPNADGTTSLTYVFKHEAWVEL